MEKCLTKKMESNITLMSQWIVLNPNTKLFFVFYTHTHTLTLWQGTLCIHTIQSYVDDQKWIFAQKITKHLPSLEWLLPVNCNKLDLRCVDALISYLCVYSTTQCINLTICTQINHLFFLYHIYILEIMLTFRCWRTRDVRFGFSSSIWWCTRPPVIYLL